MTMQTGTILSVLDRCCSQFTFPMLDNGYVYLAATRLSLHRSIEDWAMVIEVFGFSPRAGQPDTHIYTFASRLHNRDTPDSYQDRKQYEDYLANNPNNDSRFISPIDEGDWQDSENGEMVAKKAKEFPLRGSMHHIPSKRTIPNKRYFSTTRGKCISLSFAVMSPKPIGTPFSQLHKSAASVCYRR